MTITNTLTISSSSPPFPKPILKPHFQTPLFKNTSFKTPTQTLFISLNSTNHFTRLPTAIYAKNNDTADGPDRLISAICYFYPFFDGIQYGKYVINQFSFLQTLISPLVPAIRVFKSFPFNGFLVFLTLYFVVVRNNNFSRYVRFNTMQAIVLDVLLIFPDLIERTFNPKDGVGLDLLMSLDSTVFLFLLVSLIYGCSYCVIGQVPRLPIVADAADRQVM
ncbi:protein TIC 20-V, chloroplastic [Tanacetum coccineum]